MLPAGIDPRDLGNYGQSSQKCEFVVKSTVFLLTGFRNFQLNCIECFKWQQQQKLMHLTYPVGSMPGSNQSAEGSACWRDRPCQQNTQQ